MYPNDNWGKNELMGSTMQIYLNGTGDNKRSGSASTYGLKETAKNMISDAKYYLGGARNYNGYGTADAIYLWERGTEVISYENYCIGNGLNTKCTTANYCDNNPTDEICNVTRSKFWVGEVALMYPSDEYLVNANEVDSACYTDPTKCFIDSYGTAESNGTPSNGWIYNSNNNLEGQSGAYDNWLLSTYSEYSDYVFHVYSIGKIASRDTSGLHRYGTRPVLYLSSNVKIIDGTGEQNNPYKLGL